MNKSSNLLVVLLSSLFYGQTLTTQIRDNAGLPTTQSGFYETNNPQNYPSGATSRWHLLDIRHSDAGNNYGLQLSGSFFDQSLWFRKTNNNGNQLWSKIVAENPSGNVGVGTTDPQAKLDVDFNNEPKSMRFFQPSPNTNPQNTLISSLLFRWYNENADFGMIRGLGDNIIGLSFRFNGNEKMRLNSNGDLGIGTNTPQARLDVNGNARINSNSEYTFISVGQEANDQIIADNSIQKHFGGGYFFRVHNSNATNNFIDAVTITEDGNVGIGEFHPHNKLHVAGSSVFNDNMKVSAKIEAKEVKVTQTPTADFVFADNYGHPKLEDVEKHIKAKRHLPEIASAKEMEQEGVNVGEFQIKLLQKIEELTLYSIEQNKQLKGQNEQLKIQADKIEKLEQALTNQKIN